MGGKSRPTEFSMIPRSEWQTPECVLSSHMIVSGGTPSHLRTVNGAMIVQMNQHFSGARLGHVQRFDLCADLAGSIVDAGLVLLRQLDFRCSHLLLGNKGSSDGHGNRLLELTNELSTFYAEFLSSGIGLGTSTVQSVVEYSCTADKERSLRRESVRCGANASDIHAK